MEDVQELLDGAVRDGVFPGAVARDANGRTYATGDAALCDLWDMASVSKVVATTSLAAMAVDRGDLDLAAPVRDYWPESRFPGPVRDLLLHEAGYPAFRPYHLLAKSRGEVVRMVAEEVGGGKNVYSDLSMIALAEILERIEGRRLDVAFADRVARPFGLGATGYRPAQDRWGLGRRIAPTERSEEWRGSDDEFIVGVVHDPTAWRMDGVAGHAGLFSTLDDLTTFLTRLVAGDVTPRWREWGGRHSARSSRALGWDTYDDGTFGHTGYTGTSVRIDPKTARFAILLSNRVHPTAANRKILDFRPIFHAQAF